MINKRIPKKLRKRNLRQWHFNTKHTRSHPGLNPDLGDEKQASNNLKIAGNRIMKWVLLCQTCKYMRLLLRLSPSLLSEIMSNKFPFNLFICPRYKHFLMLNVIHVQTRNVDILEAEAWFPCFCDLIQSVFSGWIASVYMFRSPHH